MAAAQRLALYLLLLCTGVCVPPWRGHQLMARAAEVLNAEDAAWLALLQPSARSGLQGWMEAHDTLAQEVQEAKEAGGLDVMVYGDSIMEAFRAQCMGFDWAEHYSGNKAAWDRAFAGKRAGLFALCGDQAVHLLWRLGQGEGPQELNPKVVTVMIGTNDAAHLSTIYPGDGDLAGHIISLAVQQNVRELQRQAPTATIVVLGLLPLQPQMLGRPDRTYDPIIAAANRDLAAYVQKQASPRLRFKDCGPAMVLPSGEINYALMPDGVHPAGEGGEALLGCMLEEIRAAAPELFAQ